MHGQAPKYLVPLLFESLLSLLDNVMISNIGYQGVIVHFISFFTKIRARPLLFARFLPGQLNIEMIIVNLVS